ncbi:MAG: hypothetical protein R3F55_25460 [Alphaproteobacteria bacterium]
MTKPAHGRRAIRGGLAACIAMSLAACVPVAGTPQGPGVGPGPGFGPAASNGVWSVPFFDTQGAPWTTSEGALRMRNVEELAGPTSLFLYGVYEDGTRLVWGTLDYATGKWQGNWARAGGPVACPIALPPPPQLVGEGFQFQQPLYVWGTFDVTMQGEIAFDGSWGSCGIPVGAAWTGRAQGA